MITLKEFNSLPKHKRKRAVEIVFFNMPEFYIEKMSEEWHHRLDAEHRLLLESIYKRNDGKHSYYIVRSPDVVL